MPARRIYKFSIEDIEKIIYLRKEERLKLSVIAERYSCLPQRIVHVLRNNGIAAEKRGKKEEI